MIRELYKSACGLAIVPMQDVIGLGDEARMKVTAHIHAWYPGASGGLAVARAIAGDGSISGRNHRGTVYAGAALPLGRTVAS